MLKGLFYGGPSLSDLHEHYAKRGRIDHLAPSISLDEILIDAEAEKVWNALIDISSWPTYNPIIDFAKAPPTITVGEKAVLKVVGVPTEITFAVVEPNRELTWTGHALWVKAIDQFLLERVSESVTRLHLNESLAGYFVPLFAGGEKLRAQHQASLRSIKDHVETGP